MNNDEKFFSALIVDDEDLARQDLKDVLSEFENIKIVAEADSVRTAKEELSKYHPHIIFLDIHLPGESGFDLLDAVPEDVNVIFVTAFDQYAIRAFEVNAMDYLLKPVSRERIATALERLDNPLGAAADDLRPLTADDSIFLKKDRGYSFIKISTLVCVEARDDYSLISLSNSDQILVHKSMKEWEYRLPPEIFCRIHRSTIINIEKVKSIDPWYNQSYLVVMKGRENPLVMSRRYFAKIKNKMG